MTHAAANEVVAKHKALSPSFHGIVVLEGAEWHPVIWSDALGFIGSADTWKCGHHPAPASAVFSSAI